MAFPGNFNFNYYRGDTYEFKIYPKDSSGAQFDLSQFDKTEGVKFVISSSRGADGLADQIEAFAEIAANETYILCAIRPQDATGMILGRYVYDVELSRENVGGDYPYTYTILTGNIDITDQVAGAIAE